MLYRINKNPSQGNVSEFYQTECPSLLVGLGYISIEVFHESGEQIGSIFAPLSPHLAHIHLFTKLVYLGFIRYEANDFGLRILAVELQPSTNDNKSTLPNVKVAINILSTV